MYLIFKLKARTLDRQAAHAFPFHRGRSKTHTTTVAAAARCINTVAAVCVCVFSALRTDGRHNEDEDDDEDIDEENMRRRLAAFDPYDEEALLSDMFGDARAIQRHEVERACRMGMSVSLLEELWMEKIVIELQRIVGKRRRRRLVRFQR